MGKKILTFLGIILVLVAALAEPMLVMADSGDTTVTANFESITITAPTGQTDLILNSIGTDQSLVSSTGLVTSTVAYDVTAVDAMNDTKAAGDAGQMTEWTGSAWNSTNKISSAVQVGSSMTTYGVSPAAISDTSLTIVTGAPAGAAVDTQITVTVDTAGEAALDPPSLYKIVITFTATAAS